VIYQTPVLKVAYIQKHSNTPAVPNTVIHYQSQPLHGRLGTYIQTKTVLRIGVVGLRVHIVNGWD